MQSSNTYENGLDAVAVYTGRSDHGDDDCHPTWDLFTASRTMLDDSDAFAKLKVSVDASETADVKLTQQQSTVRKWTDTDPEELDDVDPDAEDTDQVLRQQFATEESELVDITPSNKDDQLLIDALTIGATAALALSGYGVLATAGVSVVGALVGFPWSSRAQQEHDDKYTALFASAGETEETSFFYLPNIELVPIGEIPTGELRSASVEVDLKSVASREGKMTSVQSTTLDLEFREDLPFRLVGNLQREQEPADDEVYLLQTAAGDTLARLADPFSDDILLDVDGYYYDAWVSEEEFPLRLVSGIVDIDGGFIDTTSLVREIHLEDFVTDPGPYETVSKDLSDQNQRVVVAAGGPGESEVPTPAPGSTDPFAVYLPMGTDRYAMSRVGASMAPEDAKVAAIPGTLKLSDTGLEYWTSVDQSYTVEGSDLRAADDAGPGSVWVHDDELRYVDEGGRVRAISGSSADSVPGESGSLWIEERRLAYVGEDGQKHLIEPANLGEVDVEVQTVTVDPASVDVGDSVDVTASYANAGGEGSERVRLSVGDRTATEVDVPIPAGASTSVSWTIDVQQADVGDQTVSVEFLDSGNSASADLTVQAVETDTDIVIDSFEVLEEFAVPGESVTLSASYRNTGEEVDVVGRHFVGDRLESTKEFSVEAGQSVTGTREMPVEKADLGQQTVTYDLDPGPSASDDLHVLIQKPSLSVDTLSVERDAVAPGDAVDVSLSISNTGAEKTSDIARLWYGDDLVFEEHVSLDVYGSEEFSVAIDTGIDDIGTNQLRAETARSDYSETTEFEVQDPCGDADADGLLVDSLSVPSDMRVGQSATATATVTYCGDGGGAAAPELFLDGRSVDSFYGGYDQYETTDVEFELTPTAGEWGERSLRVETNVDEASQTVQIAPAPFTVGLGEGPAVEGESLSATATVTNEGAGLDVQPVELSVDGEIVDSVQVELEAGATTDVELTSSVSVGEHDVVVSSQTDEATATVERTPPAVTATLGSIPNPVVRTTEELDVPTTIENPGTSTRTVDVVVSGGGGKVTETVQVEPGAEATPAPSLRVELSGAQELTVDLEAIVDDEVQSTDSTTVPVTDEVPVPCEEAGGTTASVDGQTVCDVNGDGDYRDVTGDGSVTNTDVTTFFSNQHAPAWNERPDLFDFDGDGNVGQSDVIELFEYVIDA